jgi:hypothetical protein
VALSKELREEGLKLAKSSTWGWGDWALKVAPMSSSYHDQSTERISQALDELVESGEVSRSDLPALDSIRQYREAAAAIPERFRKNIRSIEVGRILGQKCKDEKERAQLIGKLKNAKGIVTVDAIRAHFAYAQTNTGTPPPPQVTQARSAAAKTPAEKEAEQRIKSAQQTAQAAAAEGRPLSAHFWRIIGKLDQWRRDMAVLDDELLTLTQDERERVVEAAQALRDQADRWIAILTGSATEDGDTIDGTAREVDRLSLTR